MEGAMKNKKEDIVTDRRDLLKMTAAGAVAAGAVAMTGTASAQDEIDTSGEGYRETELVKTYYKSARF